MNTTDTLLVFTNGGNYLHIPVHIIPDLKWKDMPKHVSNIIEVPGEESVIGCIPAYDFSSDKNNVELRTLEINLQTREIIVKGEETFEKISQIELRKYLDKFAELNK